MLNKVCIIGSYAKALVMTAERIPLVGETLLGHDYRETYGGKGSDMAVQAARLGAEINYIGVVGADNFGREFMQLMKDEGVNTAGIRETTIKPTGVGFIVKDKQAQNIIVVDKGANELFSRTDINEHLKLIEDSDVVLAQLEIPLDTALFALQKAKDLGKTTILNPAPASDLSTFDLSFVDILTPNETEARLAIGMHPQAEMAHETVAKALLKTGCKQVIMTLGGDGAVVYSKEESFPVSSCKIDVIDSNGAGDSFNAALSVGLAQGKGIRESVAYANAAAGLCCTKWETVPSYHTAKEVAAFIAGKQKREKGE